MLLSQKSLTEQQRIENTLLVVFCWLFWMAILLFIMATCMAFRFWSLAKGKTNRITQPKWLVINLHCEAARRVQHQDEAIVTPDQQDQGYASIHDLDLIWSTHFLFTKIIFIRTDSDRGSNLPQNLTKYLTVGLVWNFTLLVEESNLIWQLLHASQRRIWAQQTTF